MSETYMIEMYDSMQFPESDRVIVDWLSTILTRNVAILFARFLSQVSSFLFQSLYPICLFFVLLTKARRRQQPLKGILSPTAVWNFAWWRFCRLLDAVVTGWSFVCSCSGVDERCCGSVNAIFSWLCCICFARFHIVGNNRLDVFLEGNNFSRRTCRVIDFIRFRIL